MTTLGLRLGRRWYARDLVAVAGLAVWLGIALTAGLGLFEPPVEGPMSRLLIFGVPGVLAVIAVLHRSESSALSPVAFAACAMLAALVLPPMIATQPKVAYAFPALAVGAVLTQRFPTVSLVALFALCGAYGSITAFTGLPSVSLVDALLGGLWAGIGGRLLIGRRTASLRPSPAFFMLVAFMVVTVAAVLATEPLSAGISAFRLAPLYLSAAILVGWGAFTDRTLEGLARAIAVVSLVLAAYASLRWAIGPAPQERALLRSDFTRQYNVLAGTGDEKVRGALPNGFLLGLWMACTVPFLVAMALAWSGVWRLVAVAALPLSLIGLLGSGQRAGAVAVVAGSLTIVALHLLARGFRGPRLVVALAAVLTFVAAGALAYPAVLDNPEKRERYESILTPEQDAPFQERLTKWRQVLADLDGHPLGFGMGAGNPSAIGQRFVDIATRNIDNSYLMIAFDQGLAVMALFLLAMVVLLFELIRHAVWTRGPGEAALAAAAAGTLVSMLIEFTSANYITARPSVAGWLIVGLGIAQYTSRRGATPAPARTHA